VHEIAILFEAAAALQDFLRFGLILPEIGRGGAGLEAGQLFVGTGRFKDSSANRWRVCRGPRTGASSHRLWACQTLYWDQPRNHEGTKDNLQISCFRVSWQIADPSHLLLYLKFTTVS
jgi:hypothetical protein